MSLQFNNLTLSGNLTRDPEYRSLPGDKAVCNVGLAVHRSWRNQGSGEMQEEVTFVDLEAWGQTADFIAGHFSKGDALFITGRLRQKNWETDAGEKRSKLICVVEEARFVLNKAPARAAADARIAAQRDATPAALPPRAPVAVGQDEPPF